MAKSNASGLLTSLDSLFTTQEQRDEAKRDSVQDIPISQISDFPEHPFKVKQDEAMLEMAESVRQYGILVPGLVRQLEDGCFAHGGQQSPARARIAVGKGFCVQNEAGCHAKAGG